MFLRFWDAMERVTGRQVASEGRVYSSEDRMEGAMVFAEKRELGFAGEVRWIGSGVVGSRLWDQRVRGQFQA
jgi:hypothetical protein